MMGTKEDIESTVVENVDTSKEIATSGTEVGLEVDANELSRVKAMSLKQIDEYGSTIQDMIGSKSTAILQKATVNDTGATMKKGLDDLQDVVDKQRKMLPTSKSPMRLFRKFTANYTKVEKRIDDISDVLNEHKEKLDKYVQYMMEQSQGLGEAVKTLRKYEGALAEYAKELELADDPDQIRLQAVASRLKIITSTRINAEQAQVESLMIIKANQESKYQLEQVVQNVMPILKMQAVNAIGIKANQESLEIAERTKKITGDLIERNAADVKSMVDKLQSNRTSGVIDEDKLMSAQHTLQEAIKTVMEASEKEAKANMEISKRLRENSGFTEQHIKDLSRALDINDSNAM